MSEDICELRISLKHWDDDPDNFGDLPKSEALSIAKSMSSQINSGKEIVEIEIDNEEDEIYAAYMTAMIQDIKVAVTDAADEDDEGSDIDDDDGED